VRGEHQILQEETLIEPTVLRERRVNREDKAYWRFEEREVTAGLARASGHVPAVDAQR
jgi:hypothetical protein